MKVTTTYRYEVIEVKGVHRWVDADGKKRQQTKKFFQTLNPFNLNKDGTAKTRDDIRKEITAERDKWLRDMRLKDSDLFSNQTTERK